MNDIDTNTIEIALIINFFVSACILSLLVLFGQLPDNSIIPLYVGIIAFVALSVAEFLCWLFHIPAWIYKGLTWIHDKTEPKE